MSALVLLVLASASAPDRVVVYPQGAQVTRVASLTCGVRVAVLFENIPPAARAGSFRATLSAGTVDGLRAELVSQQSEYGQRAQRLLTELDELQAERTRNEDRVALGEAQVRLGAEYDQFARRQIARELALERPDVKAWQAALEGALATGLAGAKVQAEAAAKRRALLRRQGELDQELATVRAAAAKQAWKVEVLASCPVGQRAELELSYQVSTGGWRPSYEARADEVGGFVELSTTATLQQDTGEPWTQVALVLSTGQPSGNATPPTLKKLMVQAAAQPPERKMLVSREERAEHASAAQQDEAGDSADLVVTDQGLSVDLAVPARATIAGDGAPVRLVVGKTRLAATFEVAAFPRVHPVAFRVARLVNQAPWPLLAGRLDAFRATGLVGSYFTDAVPKGAPFTITFGVDDSVRVKRFTVAELTRDTGFLGDRVRFSYHYRIELANYGKARLRIELNDQVPVSELADVSVAIADQTTPGYRLDPKDGLTRWTVPLEPGQQQRVDLAFRVEVPKRYDLGGP